MTSPSPAPPSAAPAPASRGRPTRQLLLIMLIALASSFALSQAFRTLGAIMATPLSQHFSLSPLQIGLWASAFHLSFGLLQLAMGVSLDMHGVRRTILGAFPMTIMGAALCAFSTNFTVLLIGQALIGIGCAPAFLACTVFIARHFEASRFSALSGLTMSMSGVGILFTGTPLALLIEAASWRAGYIGLGLLSVLCWVAMYLLVHEPALPASATPAAAKPSWRQAARELLPIIRMPQTLGLVCFASVSYAGYITLRGLWLGPALHDRHGLSLISIGNVVLVMTLAGMVGQVLFGRLDPGDAQRTRWMSRCALIAAAMFALTAFTHVRWIDIAVPIFYALLSGYGVLQYAYVKNSYPAAVTGRAISVLNTAMFLGIALMQWISGVAASWVSAPGVDVYRAVFLTIAGMLTLGTLLFMWLPQARPTRPDAR